MPSPLRDHASATACAWSSRCSLGARYGQKYARLPLSAARASTVMFPAAAAETLHSGRSATHPHLAAANMFPSRRGRVRHIQSEPRAREGTPRPPTPGWRCIGQRMKGLAHDGHPAHHFSGVGAGAWTPNLYTTSQPTSDRNRRPLPGTRRHMLKHHKWCRWQFESPEQPNKHRRRSPFRCSRAGVAQAYEIVRT